ncbi:MAG: HD domain-containing protein [Acidobacteria bacterium]|nr:HD domain-containing protein [Acidobacteriota bacterium]
MSLGETLLIGVCSTLWQAWWRPTGPRRWSVMAFNAAVMCIALAAAHTALHSSAGAFEGAMVVPLIVASIVFYGINVLLISTVIGLTSDRPVLDCWTELFWSFPYYLLSASLAGAVDWVWRTMGIEVALLALPVIYVIFRSYKLQVERLEQQRTRAEELQKHAEELQKHAEELQKHAEQVAALHLRTIQALALAIEAKDDTTHDHLQRVQVYAHEVAKELGLNESEMKALEAASFLHDIGKLAVPDYIISKPGKLTPEEFEKMKIHPVVGAEILESVEFPYPVVPIVRAHHEKWDGSGYPYGLRGEEIPVGARILSAVDCLDALASHRQYRPAMPLDKAMQIVRSESGKAYDPKVVEILSRRYVELEHMAKTAVPQDTTAPKLSKDMKIARGEAPGAGFHETGKRSQLATIRHEAPVLEELANELNKTLDTGSILQTLETKLKLLIPFDCIAVYTRSGEKLIPEYVQGEDAPLFSSLEIPVGQGLSGWVAQNRKALVNGNPAVEPSYLHDPSKETALRSGLAVPLVLDERSTGVIALYSAEKDFFNNDHMRALQLAGARVAVALQNAAQYKAAQGSNQADTVTGLPNAAALFPQFDAEVNRSKRSGSKFTVLSIDLNRFRLVNEKVGMQEGDRILRSLG